MGCGKVFSCPSRSSGVTQSQAIAMKTSRIVVGDRKVAFRLTSSSLSQGKICGIKGAQEEASRNC